MKPIFKLSILWTAICLIAAFSCTDKDNSVGITSFTLSETDIALAVGETKTVTATITPATATETLLWTTSNSGVATVVGGDVTGLLPGTTTVTVSTIDGKIQKLFTVTVSVPATGITLNVKELTLSYLINEQKTVPYTLSPVQALSAMINWTSDKPQVATVDAVSGVITAIAPGTATITATLENGASDFCTITIKEETKVTGITLDTHELSLMAGQTATIGYTISPADATNTGVTWSSDALGVASVDAISGVVTAIAAGTANITVTTVDGGFTDGCVVEVSELPQNLLLNPGFEDPVDGTSEAAIPTGWAAVPNDWFTAYYVDAANPPDPNGRGNQATAATPQRGGSGYANAWFDTNANGQVIFASGFPTGKFVERFAVSVTTGIRQKVTVDEGKTYEFGCEIFIRRANANSVIKDFERVKILNSDGTALDPNDATFGTALIDLSSATSKDTSNNDASDYYIISVRGQVLIPAGVTEVLFQIDSRNFPTLAATPPGIGNSPVMAMDECFVRWLP